MNTYGETEAIGVMDVYFNEEPEIDYAALAAWINGCDKGEESPCEAETNPELAPQVEGIRMTGGVVMLGDFVAALIGHNVPSPAADLFDRAPMLPPPLKKALAAHKGFVLVTLHGGEGYNPVERMIFLLKIAAALSRQGAIGFGFPLMGTAFPAALLMDLSPFEKGGGLFNVMRTELMPMEILMNAELVQGPDNAGVWMRTAGNETYGFPDFASPISDPKNEAEAVHELFANALTYMFQNGPVLKPGDTMGFDEKTVLKFRAPAREETWLSESNAVLIFDRQEPPKKKGLFGKLFG